MRFAVIATSLLAVPTFVDASIDEPGIDSAETVQPYEAVPQRMNRPDHIRKLPGRYSRSDWAATIDSTWGPGLLTTEKLGIFDLALDRIDSSFAAFNGLDIDVDSLRVHYRPEIEAGVSRGRFAAIMNRVSMSMKEGHTFIGDLLVNTSTDPAPGVPLLFVDSWADVTHFGAGLTPLPDQTLLVYKAVSEHPLGLEPGDIVLGYEGVAWPELAEELWAAELPIYFSFPTGTSNEAREHARLMSAGMNWHLFDTIDVLKHDTGDTLHLATAPLDTQSVPIWGNEMLPVAGIDPPSYDHPIFGTPDRHVTWGFIEDTDIAYLQVSSWAGPAGAQFLAAADSLVHHVPSSGLVMDFRLNYGGGNLNSYPGLEVLFNETVSTTGWDVRCGDPDDHFEMCPNPARPESLYVIEGDPDTFYDRPIAVLTGPGCFSNGDQNAMRMRFHPNTRVFGKETSGGFTAGTFMSLGDPDWLMILTTTVSYLTSDPSTYLHRQGTPVDEPTWLTPEDVAIGRDTVLEDALAWIRDTTDADEDRLWASLAPSVSNEPNPFAGSTSIHYELATAGDVVLNIFDAGGRQVRSALGTPHAAGHHQFRWDGTDDSGRPLRSGVYFYRFDPDPDTARIRDESERFSGKMTLVR